ncbi:AarF/ABC1/UbiB kinase family protein [Barrientosiimonas marina]|uniref:ABC1 kinase family protein n=1 Tax=Lentibacillus kimchii TaxID=1542911 RepID=A0ABW2UR23_9BACI
MLGKGLRHTRRYREIINALIKHGFGYFLSQIGLTDRGTVKKKGSTEENKNMRSMGKQLRLTLQELGPTAIKLGQIASTRYDTLPEEITAELEKLQDHAPIIDFANVQNTIESEFDDSLDHLFTFISSAPLATASIGQVHAAQLLTGEDVAVKVQRPGLKPQMETDLEIVAGIARLLEERMAWAQHYRLTDIVDELAMTLRNELDYLIEGRNAEHLAEQSGHHIYTKFPEIYWDFTTEKVLTMENISGIKVSEIEELDEKGYDRKLIAKRLSDAMLRQILDYGFFHADPHSGNIFVMPQNTIAFLDFGETARISEKLKRHFAAIIVNLYQGETDAMIKTFTKMDIIEEDTDTEALKRDLDQLHQRYENVKVRNLSLGQIITGIFSVVNHHHIKIPTEIVMISKAVLTLEGVLGRLDPAFSLMRAAEPYARKLLQKRYHPRELLRNSLAEIGENIDILTDMPRDLKDVMTAVKRGRIGLDINVKHVSQIMRRLDKITNRITFSILMLAFSIIMAGLIIGYAVLGKSTIIWDLPIIEIGAVVAMLMFILMVIMIIRSNRM